MCAPSKPKKVQHGGITKLLNGRFRVYTRENGYRVWIGDFESLSRAIHERDSSYHIKTVEN